jgi:hypothetical protein
MFMAMFMSMPFVQVVTTLILVFSFGETLLSAMLRSMGPAFLMLSFVIYFRPTSDALIKWRRLLLWFQFPAFCILNRATPFDVWWLEICRLQVLNAWLHTSLSTHLSETLWMLGWMLIIQIDRFTWHLGIVFAATTALAVKLLCIQHYIDVGTIDLGKIKMVTTIMAMMQVTSYGCMIPKEGGLPASEG